MQNTRNNSESLNPTGTYSLSALVRLKAIPTLKSFTAYRNLVMRDMVGENVFKAKILGDGRATRIYIKGQSVLDYQNKQK